LQGAGYEGYEGSEPPARMPLKLKEPHDRDDVDDEEGPTGAAEDDRAA
jgi:hypothetical protein